MNTLSWIILSTVVVSLISFIGILTLILKKKTVDEILWIFVAISAGAMIGSAFFHLIPEALEKINTNSIFIFIIIGFTFFFLIEKILFWHHCHTSKKHAHTFAYMNLIGDGFHNFIDGLIIAASFIVDFNLGIITTFAIIMHEIPQEIGDFGVLLYGGFKASTALLFNFITALTAVLGGVLGYYLSNYVSQYVMFLLAFAAGGFIYIGASDLLPEIKNERNTNKSILGFIIFLLGIAIIFLLGYFE